MIILNVKLAEQSYDIHIGSGILPLLGDYCSAIGLTTRAAIITNPTVNPLYGECVRTSLEKAGCTVHTIEIPDGEEFKNGTTLSKVYDELIEAGLDRKSFIVALGGGVVGDLAGFAAATYLRGIPFVQIPTTLLAQVDSSVGGKTAIDHPRGKNLIGAFYQPRLVLIDINTLNTLPKREFRAGMAEVIKYGVALDEQFFSYLEQNIQNIIAMDSAALTAIIEKCCHLKAQIVEQDEKEDGLRAVLNYGHTLGHAFETMAGYREMVHGEAVAIGMTLAGRISAAAGECSTRDAERIVTLLQHAGLSTRIPEVGLQALRAAMATDKKSRNGTITFILNHGIGNCIQKPYAPEELLSLCGLEV